MNFVLEYLLLLSLLLFLVDDTKGYWGGGKDDPGDRFTRIAKKGSCRDKHTYKGYKKTRDLCADVCWGSSSVFVYGNSNRRCSGYLGCKCWCITGATRAGKCLRPYSHSYYDTYRINPNYDPWTQWTACSQTCGRSERSRTRQCNHPMGNGRETDCVYAKLGAAVEREWCNRPGCPVDGGYTNWSVWGACSSCKDGTKHRTRECTNPPPQPGGKNCTGSSRETKDCSYTSCTDYISDLMRKSFSELDKPALDESQKTKLAEKWKNVQERCVEYDNCKAEYSKYATHMEQVAHGFTAAQEITEGVARILKKGRFKEIARSLTKLAPFLGATSAVFEIFGLFGNSPEVERLDQVIGMLNEGFNRMEYRFDRIEKKFADLENLIKKEFFWTRLHSTLTKLINVQSLVNRYFAVNKTSERAERQKELEKEYSPVYQAIGTIKSTFKGKLGTAPLCNAVKEFSDVKRRIVLEVSTDLFNRMIRGAVNFILIGKTLNRTDNHHDEKEMIGIIQEVSRLIEECEENIGKEDGEWKKKWVIDLHGILEKEKQNKEKGRENAVANNIYGNLTSKYYWRDWLVVVYPEMALSNVHWRKESCGIEEGTTKEYMHWEKKYNILVSSMPSTYPNKIFTGYVKGYRTERYKHWIGQGNWSWKTRTIHYNAKQIYQHMPNFIKHCDYPRPVYPLVGIVIKRGTVVVLAPENRKYHRVITNKKSQLFDVFILG